MSSDFSIKSQLIKKILVLRTTGYINNNGGEVIINEFNKYLDEGMENVLMDLADSKIVNSIGISYLIEMIEKLNEINGKLYFMNLDPAIEKTFTIMGIFQFAESVNSINDIN